MEAKILQKEYVVLDKHGGSELWNAEDFWKVVFDPQPSKNEADLGYLVSQFNFDSDWDSWENHPEGDELVFCISGKIKLVLEIQSNQTEIDLEPGTYVVVPKNTWHTAKTSEPSSALFVTWGQGTQHRKIES